MSSRRDEGSVYQRSDGRWCAAITLPTGDGKQHRKTVYAKTEKEALRKLENMLREQRQGMLVVDEKQTVQEYLDRWLEQIVAHRNAASTHRSYSDQIRLHIKPAIGHYRLAALTPEQVQNMLNRQTETLSARTVSYNRSILHRALEQARMWGYVSRNVVALTDAPRQRKSQIKPLTVMQAQQFLRAVKGHRLEILYRVALGLGLRRGEILALTWDDVDLTERRLNIIAGKTEASIRVLPLPPQLCSSLEKHKQRQHEEQGKAGSNWTDHNLVFPSQVGNPIHPRNLIRHFKSVLNDVQLPPSIRFHDLRHSCASFLIVQNVHPRSIMEILGHSQIAVTMNTYGHIELESQRLALEGLDAQFE